MNKSLLFVLLAFALLIGGAVAVIVLLSNSTATNTVVSTDRTMLVSMREYGGLCADGVCEVTFEVGGSGVFSLTDGVDVLAEGTLTDEQLTELKKRINETDFSAISATTFEGVCPTAYDGFAYSYDFRLPGGTHALLDTCEQVVSPDEPVTQYVRQLRLDPFDIGLDA